MFSSLIRAIQVENIKSRHTRLIILSIFLAIALPGLLGIFQLFGIEDMGGNTDTAPSNFADLIHKIATVFSMFLYPMGIVMIAAQGASVEHKNNTWSLAETQALPKWAIFTAKYIKVLWSMLVLVFLFYFFSYLITYLIYVINESDNPSYYFSIPLGETFLRILNMWCSGMAYAAIFFVFHINLKRTNLISTLGIVSVLGYMISQGFQFHFPNWFPLVAMSFGAGRLSEVGTWLHYFSRISMLESVWILIIGYGFYAYRTRKAYFFKDAKGLIRQMTFVVLAFITIYYIQKPRFQESHGTTIVNGHIDSDIPVQEIQLRAQNTQEVIATIPVNSDGHFHYNLSNIHLPKQQYYFSLSPSGLSFSNMGDDGASHAFLTDGDSIYVKLSYKDNFTSIAIDGDRRAESQAQLVTSPYSLIYIHNMLNFQRTKSITREYVEEKCAEYYKKDIERLDNQITIDGYKVGADVMNFQKTLINVFYLEAWYTIMKEHFPEEKDLETDWVKQLKSGITADDEDLWRIDAYVNYQLKEINNNEEVTILSRFELIPQIKTVVGQQLAWEMALKDILMSETIADSVALGYYHQYIDKVTSPSVRQALNLLKLQRDNKINPQPLPELSFINKAGEVQSLSQFTQQYVLVNIGASSCINCIQDEREFGKMAEKYKDKNIQFLSLTIDQNKEAWQQKAAQYDQVLSWHADKTHQLFQLIPTLEMPQYILIAPGGVIADYNFPSAISEDFEEILSKILP